MIRRRSLEFKTEGFEIGQLAFDLGEIGADFPWIVDKVREDLFLQAKNGALPHEFVVEDGPKLTLLANELAGVAVLSSLDDFLDRLKPARKHRSPHGLPTNE